MRSSSRVVNAQLLECSDSAQVLSLVREWGETMNVVNLSTAWHRLAQLSRGKGAELPQEGALGAAEQRKPPSALPPGSLGELEALTRAFALRRLFDARSSCVVLWSMASLGYAAVRPEPPPKPGRREKKTAAERDAGREAAREAELRDLFLSSVRKQLASASEHGLSLAAWAAAHWDCDSARDLVLQIQLCSKNWNLHFSPPGWTNLLWASARMALRLPTALLRSALALLRSSPDKFSHYELSCLAWSLAEMRFDPGAEVLNLLDEQLSSRLAEFSSQAIANAFWAFAILQHTPFRSIATLGELFRAAEQARLEKEAPASSVTLPPLQSPAAIGRLRFSAMDLDSLVWSLSLLAAFHTPLFTAVWRLCAAMPPASHDNLGGAMLYQAALLWDAHVHLAEAAAEKGVPRPSGRPSNVEAAALFDRVDAAAELPPSRALASLPREVVAHAAAFWRRSVGVTSVTELHVLVCKLLESMGLKYASEFKTADGLFSIDVALRFVQLPSAENGPVGRPVFIAIEVDGPRHFCYNTRGRNGRTVARDALLAARGWRVCSLSHYDWNALETDEERRGLVRGRLAALGAPGEALLGGGR